MTPLTCMSAYVHICVFMCIYCIYNVYVYLVRYFEELARDEVSASVLSQSGDVLSQSGDGFEDHVSSCSSLHDWHSHNLMQPPQNYIGETLHDCIDFDELLNDFHSTAASAQLLQRSLSGLAPSL